MFTLQQEIKGMTKTQAKSILEQMDDVAEVLFRWEHDPDMTAHCESDGPYTGDLTCVFGMEVLGLALGAFTKDEITTYGYTKWQGRYDAYMKVCEESEKFFEKERA